MEEVIKNFLKDNLCICADLEDMESGDIRMVITLMLGREKISETKVWVKQLNKRTKNRQLIESVFSAYGPNGCIHDLICDYYRRVRTTIDERTF